MTLLEKFEQDYKSLNYPSNGQDINTLESWILAWLEREHINKDNFYTFFSLAQAYATVDFCKQVILTDLQ